MKSQKITRGLDGIGMTASTLCAIHCAAVPFLITLLPLWGLEFLAEEWVELSMIILALIIGSVSLGVSFRKHRSFLPLFLLLAGFTLIIAGHFTASALLEPVVIPLGGFTIAAAHLVNWRRMSCRLHGH